MSERLAERPHGPPTGQPGSNHGSIGAARIFPTDGAAPETAGSDDAAASVAGRLDADLLAAAERYIAGALASPELSPATIARSLGVSRAGLYRAFAPSGGVMRHVWAARLEAVRIVVSRPIRSRPLTCLAADHGFKSASHLSSRFRARFGVAPREWRATEVGGGDRNVAPRGSTSQ